MSCKSCGRITWFSDECKICERIRMDVWVREHTFREGDKVKLLYNNAFYKKPRVGTVVDFKKELEGTFGYYSVIPTYLVRLKSGEKLWVPVEELELQEFSELIVKGTKKRL
jgi:hypothetical protein